MHQNTCWLFGEVFSRTIKHVEQTRISKILDVVDHCGTACLQVLCQLANIGCSVVSCGKKIKEFLDLSEVLKVNLLDEKNVDFNHHVNDFKQVLNKT